MPSLRMGGGGYTVVDWGQKIGFVWRQEVSVKPHPRAHPCNMGRGMRWLVRPTGSVIPIDIDGHRTRKEAVAVLMAYLKETINDR